MYIMSVTGGLFIALAIIFFILARRDAMQSAPIAEKVRMKLAIIFLLVALGLWGYSFLAK